MKASDKTPAEKAVEMAKQGLEVPTIALCLNVSEHHAKNLLSLGRRQIAKQDETSRLQYRVSVLPQQLESARRKVAMLEREALRIGLRDLVRTDQHP